jgi:hypothetical protein
MKKILIILLFLFSHNVTFSQITTYKSYQRSYCETDYCETFNDTTEIKYQININFVKIVLKNKNEGLKSFQFNNSQIATIKNSMEILSVIYQIDNDSKIEFLYNKTGQLLQIGIITLFQVFTYIILPNNDLFV